MAEQPSRQQRSPYAANVFKYYLYIVLNGFAFGMPWSIWVIYLQQRRGLSLTQVTVIDIAFWITMTLSEIPTGVVADTWGRKASLIAGISLIGIATLLYGTVSTLFLLILSNIVLAIGATFLSGAQDALLYESLQLAGRGDEYTRIVGRAGALSLGATAVGSIAGGLLGAIDLVLPFVVSALIYVIILGVVLTFKESISGDQPDDQPRTSYRDILRQSLAVMRGRPTLRYALMYLTVVPLASVIMEMIFLQPQALSFGVPIAGIGVVVMIVNSASIAGATLAHRTGKRLGVRLVLYGGPVLSMASLVLLAVIQVLPALLFIAALGFLTAVLRPLVMNIIQNEVPDEVRATILSMQSLMFTSLLTVSEPTLGYIADQSSFSAAYVVMAGALGLFLLLMFRRSRERFPQAVAQA